MLNLNFLQPFIPPVEFFRFLLEVAFFVVFLRGIQYYLKTFDKRYLIIGAGYITGLVFLLLCDYFYYNDPFVKGYYAFCYSFTLFFYFCSLFFFTPDKQIAKSPQESKKFIKQLAFTSSVYALLILQLGEILKHYFNNPNVFNGSAQVFFGGHLLIAIVLINARVERKEFPWSFAIMAHMFTSLRTLYTAEISQMFEFLFLSTGAFNVSCVAIGMKDYRDFASFASIRYKMFAYTGIGIILFYVISLMMLEGMFGIIFDPLAYRLFMFFLLSSVTLQSVISKNISDSIIDIIKYIKVKKPSVKPEAIPVTSKDEVAVLVKELNKTAMEHWKDRQLLIQKINKERILKDIISEIKLTKNLSQAYDKLLAKLAEIFNLNRTLFLESSTINPDELNIKYKHVLKRDDLPVNHMVFPQVCIDEFFKLIHNLEPLVINDVEKCQPEETLEFFHKYKIQALLAVPLVKYSRETKVLGFIVLCSEQVRYWADEEIELIKAISESVVSVIWEISKFLETEELRDYFMLTLAHDFQVPLIGERRAMEYLLNYSECLPENIREILQEILENNQNISTLLSKSIDIYNYEAGRKALDLRPEKLLELIQAAVSEMKEKGDSKGVEININQENENYIVNVDRYEIMKVFSVIIGNAIAYSLSGTEVVIDCYKKNDRIIISVHNKGKVIPEDIQEKLFNRYEMALAIERKIGAGTGLFLSKRIVEAHNGYIWFETDEKNGTTFYVSLNSAE